MTETTPRHALPLLQAGQAQKEIWHNEALALLDGALHPCAETLGDTTPPADPAAGQAWIVGGGAAGAWAGQAEALAIWTAGGWRFAALPEGALVWVRGEGVHACRTGAGWQLGALPQRRVRIGGVQVVGARADAIAVPAGGGTVDTEARTTLSQILNILRNHGLIAS